MRFNAKYVSVGESGGEYFAVSFDNEDPSNDDFDLSGDEDPYLIVQRQFEDDDGGVCYIETHDHDTYSGHFRLRLVRFTPTRFAFEIAREDHKYVEVTYDLDAKRSIRCGASSTSFLAYKAEAKPSSPAMPTLGCGSSWRSRP
jgi:hypothetical protein